MGTSKLQHALALAARGFYVFPIVPGKKAPPLINDFPANATRDTQQIEEWWGKWSDANIGISTSTFGDGEALLVVDVDNKGAKHGNEEVLRLELEGFDLPATCTQHTPTGGRHLVYSVSAPVRQGANVLGPGLDTRSRGGYIVAAGSAVPAGEYSGDGAAIAPAPDWLVARCGKPRERLQRQDQPAGLRPAQLTAPSAEANAIRYLQTDAPLATEGDAGDVTTFKVAARCKDLGVEAEHCINLMSAHWNDRCSPPWPLDDLIVKVRNAYRYGTEAQGSAAPEADFAPIVPNSGTTSPEPKHPFDKLNQEYAFCLAGGGAHILWETRDHKGAWKLEHLANSAFHQKFAATKITVGKKTEPLTAQWMEWRGRRSYDGLVFMPGKDCPPQFYNLWRGFAVQPAPPFTKCEQHPAVNAFLDHAETNVCGGDKALFKWLMGWFAHMIQKPWEKPLVALVFRGGKGVGKGALVGRISALLGGHSLLTSNRRFLVGNFNGHMENLLLFVLDEAFWSGDKQAEGQIKDLITGAAHVIEHKGKEPYTVDNVTRICIIGNEEWLVPATHDERRFAVFDVGDGKKQDRAFFQSMREGMEAGGYAHLLRYLLDFDLSGVDVNAAPATKGLLDQKHASMTAFPRWWHECLRAGHIVGGDFDGDWLREVNCARFRQAFLRYANESKLGRYVESDEGIGRALKHCAPSVRRCRESKKDGQVQAYVYRIPELDIARAEWAEHMGHGDMKWD